MRIKVVNYVCYWNGVKILGLLYGDGSCIGKYWIVYVFIMEGMLWFGRGKVLVEVCIFMRLVYYIRGKW